MDDNKTATTAAGKVVIGFFSSLCQGERSKCWRTQLFAVTVCSSDEQGRCHIEAECTICGNPGSFVLNKKALSCTEHGKNMEKCRHHRRAASNKDETGPQKGWFAWLFGR